MNDSLKFFELTEKSTIDDVKHQYRILVKRYHPDSSRKDTSALFIQLQKHYEWLLNNHKPYIPPKLKSPINPKNTTIYYRVLADYVSGVDVTDSGYTIRIPEKVLSQKTFIYCILGLEEFRLVFDAGTKLPIQGQITNIKGTAFIKILPEWI